MAGFENQDDLQAEFKVFGMSDFGFYFGIGWEHILTIEALDHIFFIAALSAIYVLGDWKQVLVLITSFTIGHAITLILSSKGIVQVNTALVEFLVPCTIMATAVTNCFQKNFTKKAIRFNYFLALFFGLIHGLAFAETLATILARDQNFVTAWISFSLGLELAQILVVVTILLLAELVIRGFKLDRRWWVLLVSIPVFVLALKMAIERRPW